MKIAAIRATPVNIPLEAPYVWSYGSLPGFTQTIIEVETDEGLVGIGEAPGAGSTAIVTERFAPALQGRDPIDIAGAEERCVPSSRGVQSIVDFATIAAFGGLEMALWDLRGKAWGQPLYQLLGGAVRKQIAFSDYFAYRLEHNGIGGEATPEAVADYCLRLKGECGTTIFEGKVSDTDPRDAIALVKTLRVRLGDAATIRIDSNHAYTVTAARQLAPAFEELGVANWEDPVGTFEEMAALRPFTRLSLSSHNLDVPKAVRLGVPDALVTSVAGHGGVARTVKFIAVLETFGIEFWCYSGDSGVASAAYLHVLASQSWAFRPSQSLFRMQPLDVIEEGPFRPRNNLLRVPEGPGLGVTLSPERLEHAHELFLRDGPMNKYHDPEKPGIFRRLPYA